ncbi:palmitoyl-protein thioesterase ABHD10, mitochondrial-like [Narcine bancroftii]|uniref:palmitoyl-protein thioesterase ABHD10, mitochondrial-like n=1 Tax=Narcine bancroftii TaxID=1343680 RepID=UPI0038321420
MAALVFGSGFEGLGLDLELRLLMDELICVAAEGKEMNPWTFVPLGLEYFLMAGADGDFLTHSGIAHFDPTGDASTVSVKWKAWLEEFESYDDSQAVTSTPDEVTGAPETPETVASSMSDAEIEQPRSDDNIAGRPKRNRKVSELVKCECRKVEPQVGEKAAGAMSSIQFLSRLPLPRLAYHRISGRNPGVVFLSGFKSNMNGEKALALEAFCISAGYSFVRFDYTGCGSSDGNFEDCLLGDWKNDTMSVLDKLTTGPQILVGSSMGGWLMLLASLARPEKVVGMVGIATAADQFVSAFRQLPPEMRKEVETTGQYKMPSKYAANGFYTIKHDFIKEAEEQHCVLQSSIPISCPVRLLHGMKDDLVPWQNSIRVAEQLASDDIDIILRKNGDHRMSQTEDLNLLVSVVDDLAQKLTKSKD